MKPALEGCRGKIAGYIEDHYGVWLTGMIMLLDVTTIFVSILIGTVLSPVQGDSPVFGADGSYHLPALASVLGLFVFERVGLYRHEPSLMRLVEIRKITRAVVIFGLILVAYAFYSGIEGAQWPLVYSVCLVFVFVMLDRAVIFKIQQSLHSRRFHVSRVIIVGVGEAGRMLYKHINEAPELGYWVSAFYDTNIEEFELAQTLCATPGRVPPAFIADEDAFRRVLAEEKIGLIMISTPIREEGGGHLTRLSHMTSGLRVKICFIPYVSGYFAKQVQFMDINGISMVTLGRIKVNTAEQVSKRLVDLSLSLLALVLLAPVFALVAIAIRRDSDGPVFFMQQRIGKDGVPFLMYKFRTMIVDSPRYAYTPTSSDDPRITRVGRFLRRTSLDEIPQLLNVVNGTMSLVGPRPEMPFIVENEYDDFLRERLRVKPGITGVWQISADRDKQIHENIAYDIFYIENRSLLLDAIILIRTLIFAVTAMRTY